MINFSLDLNCGKFSCPALSYYVTITSVSEKSIFYLKPDSYAHVHKEALLCDWAKYRDWNKRCHTLTSKTWVVTLFACVHAHARLFMLTLWYHIQISLHAVLFPFFFTFVDNALHYLLRVVGYIKKNNALYLSNTVGYSQYSWHLCPFKHNLLELLYICSKLFSLATLTKITFFTLCSSKWNNMPLS